MTTTARLHEFLKRLDASTLPVTVVGGVHINMVRILEKAGMLEAEIPDWSDSLGRFEGVAKVLRLTARGEKVALKRSVE